MTDPVNNPSHYNQNGIEVIDVIETYAKHDFRLANVLKYVCRAGYKGHPLQDLQKAQWYLNRAVSEMEVVEALTDESWLDREESVDDAENNAWLRGYNEGYEDGEADHRTPAKYNEPEPVEGVCFPGFTPEEMDAIVDKKNELYQTFVHPTPDRIAGDDAAATRIKDNYYEYKRFEIQGYCANCDSEIQGGQPYVTVQDGYETSLKFCSQSCVEKLRTWQKELF